MISFQPTEEQTLVVQTLAELGRTRLAPGARAAEAERAYPAAGLAALHELGVGLAGLPEALGGQGLGLLTSALIQEELAAHDAAAPFAFPAFGAFPHLLVELASEERAREWLAPYADDPSHAVGVAWSEPRPRRDGAGLSTRAVRVEGGHRLTGKKCFVGHASSASHFLVLAQVDPDAGWAGLGAFLVPRDRAGLTVGPRHRTLGLDAADHGSLELEDVVVAAEERLEPAGGTVKALVRGFARHALMVAARQCGLARAAFDLMRGYSEIRRAFGKPIGHFQAVAFTLADRHMDVESARDLVRRAAWAWDTGQEERTCLAHTAAAVAQAHESAMRAADDCVQLHGGAGFIRDLIAEKLMRDAKQMATAGMTAAQADQLGAALALGVDDPALLLPTPDLQAVLT